MLLKLGRYKKKEIRTDNNILLFYNKYIIYFFNIKIYNIKWYLYNYFYFLEKKLNVPKLLSFSYKKNYFIQEFIDNINNSKNYIFYYDKVLDYIFSFYFNNKVLIDSISSIKTIRHCFYDNNSKNIGEFLINFLDFIKLKNDIKGKQLKKIIDIKKQIISNYELFNDKYIYFIHGDLKQGNILINKKSEIYFIDFENSGFFDYYYDYACLYMENKKFFLKYIKNNHKFNYLRFYINLEIYNLLNNIYNN